MIKVKITELAKYYGKHTQSIQHQCNKYGGLKNMGFSELYKVLDFYEKKIDKQ